MTVLGHLRDPAMPALETLRQSDLDRITGMPQTRLLRARYQPGVRAILHVALAPHHDADQGAIWFYTGDKPQKLARRLPDARLDAGSAALFQAFPHDHRMPQLAIFVHRADEMAQRLIGGMAAGPPALMRYRPGLSATFRWTRQDGARFFVKQTPHDDVLAQDNSIRQLGTRLAGRDLQVAAVAGYDIALGLIAYAGAKGRSLDQLLPQASAAESQAAIAQVTGALRELWSLQPGPDHTPDRVLDRPALLHRAHQAGLMIALMDPASGDLAAGLINRLQARAIPLRMRIIHADMKLEHAFLAGRKTTLIDTESLSCGDPDYDLAKLESRVTMAEIIGQIGAQQATAARAEIRRDAGPDYDWFLICAHLQGAKFFAQRFDPATITLMRRMLASC